MKKSSRTLLTLLVGTVVVLALLALVQSYTKTEGFQSSKPWTRADKIGDLLSSTKSEIDALNAEIQKAEAERQGKMNSLKAAIDTAVKEIEAKIASAKGKKEAIKKDMVNSVKVLGDRINGLNADERQGKIDANGRKKRGVYTENKKQLEAMLKTL